MASRRSSPTLAVLLRLLDEAYERRAWHGPNLRGSIRGLGAREAAWRPAAGRHNIWELVLHSAYWKYAVRRLLTGEKRGSFRLDGSNFFASPARATEKAWKADRALLDAEHRRLRRAAASIPPPSLSRRPPGSKHDAARLVYGAATHDIYHAGQIRLLKVLQKRKAARRGR